MRTLLFATLTAAAALMAGLPALAQSVDELTVTGQAYHRGEPPMTRSEVVSYRDLDLSRGRDRAELTRRISVTAGDICKTLGEAPPSHLNLGQSCQEIAVRNALSNVQVASADTTGSDASAVVRDDMVKNGPVPDTARNRARFGGPMSHAGRATSASGD